MKSKLAKLIAEKNAAIQRVEDEIVRRVLAHAAKINLDEVYWGIYSNRYRRNGKEVKSKTLDKLCDLYCDEVSRGGLEAKWTRGKDF